MNIFKVLTKGKGRLQEPNMSAMLGYLLRDTEAHGFADAFLRSFLNLVADRCESPSQCRITELLKNPDLVTSVKPEVGYAYAKGTVIVDLEIQIFRRRTRTDGEEGDVVEVHRVIVENKIRSNAANRQEDQLMKQFVAVREAMKEDAEPNHEVPITMVFLTPPGSHENFRKEFDGLEFRQENNGIHNKAWLRWCRRDGEENEDPDIVGILRDLLHKEADATIDPITDYLRHTIKAFVRFILDSDAGREQNSRPSVEPIGDIKETAEIGKYRIERDRNNRINIWDSELGEYLKPVKPILRKIIETECLNVNPHRTAGGGEQNTQTLGRDVIRALAN